MCIKTVSYVTIRKSLIFSKYNKVFSILQPSSVMKNPPTFIVQLLFLCVCAVTIYKMFSKMSLGYWDK